jgi:hypothetical protein
VKDPYAEAEQRLQALCGLSKTAAARALSEVVDAFEYAVDEFVVLRHGELHALGLNNNEIFERIAEELPRLRFKAPPLTARQIRRRVYG